MGKPKVDTSPIGDVVFFLVLLFTISLAISLCRSFVDLFFSLSFSNLGPFVVSLLVGMAIAHFILRGHVSVFIHEFKHMIASLLAGNSPRGMLVRGSSGHYEYEYTEHTKSYNAFISLAPYSLPLFTALFLGGSLYPFWNQTEMLQVIAGIGYGIDLVTSVRDISPLQTDFSALRGGFGLGILYVTALHIIMALTMVCWVTGGLEGLIALFQGAFKLFMHA